MKITDVNGKKIDVTNIAAAIEQAEYFKDCYHEPPDLIADEKLQTYWTDLHNKLLKLQSRLTNTKNCKT